MADFAQDKPNFAQIGVVRRSAKARVERLEQGGFIHFKRMLQLAELRETKLQRTRGASLEERALTLDGTLEVHNRIAQNSSSAINSSSDASLV